MLGVWFAPKCNNKKIIAVLNDVVVKWVGGLYRGNSSRQEAWTALHTNISAKLEYHLHACTISESECKIQPAIEADLPKSGIIAIISIDIRGDPSQSGGGDVLALFYYMEQLEHIFQWNISSEIRP